MEHIRQFDWCYLGGDSQHFLMEQDIDNSCTERILRNQFFDPLISSDDEELHEHAIDWDKVFGTSKPNNQRNHQLYIPCLRQGPHCPKLSAITQHQQYAMLKVVCGEYLNVLKNSFILRATKKDHSLFEELKPIYLEEQKEYIEWAKSLWTSTHCVRALRPKPDIEKVYDAEFKMKRTEFQSLPKKYEMVAQLPLSTSDGNFDILHQKDLINVVEKVSLVPRSKWLFLPLEWSFRRSPSAHIETSFILLVRKRPILYSVNINALPTVYFPELFNKRVNIVSDSSLPEPCEQHPCRFILPSENSVSNLPLTEVYTELAQYALDNGARFIASETALRCLIEIDRLYTMPVTVSYAIGSDGVKQKIIVLGSDFANRKESSKVRTYRAFRHLLQEHLISDTERLRVKEYWEKQNKNKTSRNNDANKADAEMKTEDFDVDDDDDDNLFIDMDDMQVDKEPSIAELAKKHSSEADIDPVTTGAKDTSEPTTEHLPASFTCTCKGKSYERPPPRSFRKWQVRNKTEYGHFDIIVHCSHKMRNNSGEVVIEPIPEYQLELGASAQSPEKIKSLALSLHLRRNATLVNVRVDGAGGDLATYEYVSLEDLTKKYNNLIPNISNTIHTALSQLGGLLPGNYILRHEPEHGLNVLLYAAREPSIDAQSLSLELDVTTLEEPDEAKCLKRAPVLTPVLLPWHKFRKILPLAFTWNSHFVAKEIPPKKPPMRQRTPPQAIKWPKRKRTRKKKKN